MGEKLKIAYIRHKKNEPYWFYHDGNKYEHSDFSEILEKAKELGFEFYSYVGAMTISRIVGPEEYEDD